MSNYNSSLFLMRFNCIGKLGLGSYENKLYAVTKFKRIKVHGIIYSVIYSQKMEVEETHEIIPS